MEFENKKIVIDIDYMGYPMSNRCREGNPAEPVETEFEVEVYKYDDDGKQNYILVKEDKNTMCVYITELEISGELMRDCDMSQMKGFLEEFGVDNELVKETLESVVSHVREILGDPCDSW